MDFGAGKGSLGKYVKSQCELWGCHVPKWTNYDPAIPGIDQLPDRQFDMVVSSDVLEHIEPDCIEAVIASLHKLAGKYQFHSIACDPAGLIMPDGRNAHLICERLDWWLEKFSHPEWVLMRSEDVVVRKRGTMRRHCTLQLDRV